MSKVGPGTRCCVNCHFLAWQTELPGVPTPALPVLHQERGALAAHQHCQREGKNLGCLYDVWRTHDRGDDSWPVIEEELRRLRRDKCFFYRHHTDMTFDTASALQRRDARHSRTDKRRARTHRAFQVAFAALLSFVLAILGSCVWAYWK